MPKLRNDSPLTFTAHGAKGGEGISMRSREERDFSTEEMQSEAVQRAVRMGRLSEIAEPVTTTRQAPLTKRG